MEFIEKIEPLKAKRNYLPPDLDMNSVESVLKVLKELEEREIDGVAALERWLADWDELERALDQEETVRYVWHNCYTDDEEAERRYKFFAMELLPACQPEADRLNNKYLQCEFRSRLDQAQYMVFDRERKKEADLFREENIPLQVRVTDLCSEYGKTCGAIMIDFDGKERTQQEMTLYLMERDRARREKAWRAVADARLALKETFESQFDQMMELRVQIAKNCGFKNYTDYKFLARSRFDYTPKHCFDFHEAVEEAVLPIAKAMHEERRRMLDLDALRPWDLSVEKEEKPPLRPFERVDRLIDGSVALFDRLHPELGARFRKLVDCKTLDLESRKGKRPGGFMCSLEESGVQFIFANAVGRHDDLATLLHEAGHAFHSQSSFVQPCLDYRDAPLEIAEVASMGMELIAMDGYGEFYGEEESRRAKIDALEQSVLLLPWVGAVDAFQHWLYANPGHTRDERRDFWLQNHARFEAVVDWSGLEEHRESLWRRQSHIFQSPHYYIEYGFAQLGAFQLWRNYRNDPKGTLERYIEGLSVGGSRPLPELYEAVGIKFDFSKAMIEDLMAFVRDEIAALKNGG